MHDKEERRKMNFFTKENIAKLNSMTKYPSIQTFHKMRGGGLAVDESITSDFPADEDLILSEKLDGCGTRIICLPLYLEDTEFEAHPRDCVVGSREELLHAKGDRIINPALGIVETVLAKVDLDGLLHEIYDTWEANDKIMVFYFETFGGKTTKGAKNYAGNQTMDIRLFDVGVIDSWQEVIGKTIDQISGWRENGGQRFLNENTLKFWSDILHVDLTPRLGVVRDLPRTFDAAKEFIHGMIPRTLCALDEEARGIPEGIVVRTASRSWITKMRIEDYDRAIRSRDVMAKICQRLEIE